MSHLERRPHSAGVPRLGVHGRSPELADMLADVERQRGGVCSTKGEGISLWLNGSGRARKGRVSPPSPAMQQLIMWTDTASTASPSSGEAEVSCVTKSSSADCSSTALSVSDELFHAVRMCSRDASSTAPAAAPIFSSSFIT